jgi:mitochondrial fission protein ELM1
MSGDGLAQAQVIVELADAVIGCADPLTSGSLWINTMTSLHWPAANHKIFFRAVNILRIARLVSIHVPDRERIQPTGKRPNAKKGADVATGFTSTAA